MAEPARKAPSASAGHHEVADRELLDDSFEEPTLLRWVKNPEGRLELLELPLTRELFLDPQLGDTMCQGDWHDLTAHEITDLLRNHFQPQPDIRVFREMKHYLVPGRPAPAPDVSVVRGLRPQRDRSIFRVEEEGVYPSLVIEVISSPGPEARRADLEDKVELYRLARIPEYLIIDSPGELTGMPFLLLGYRLDATGRYQPMKPDAEGRFLSETTGIWFQVSPDGERIYLLEYPTGRRLLNLSEQEDRAKREAEKASREAEARKAAEERALREAEARKTAEEKALREAEARKEAEEKVTSTEAELERLRAELKRLREIDRGAACACSTETRLPHA